MHVRRILYVGDNERVPPTTQTSWGLEKNKRPPWAGEDGVDKKQVEDDEQSERMKKLSQRWTWSPDLVRTAAWYEYRRTKLPKSSNLQTTSGSANYRRQGKTRKNYITRFGLRRAIVCVFLVSMWNCVCFIRMVTSNLVARVVASLAKSNWERVDWRKITYVGAVEMFVDVCLALQKLCIEENRRNERKKSDFFSSFFFWSFVVRTLMKLFLCQ